MRNLEGFTFFMVCNKIEIMMAGISKDNFVTENTLLLYKCNFFSQFCGLNLGGSNVPSILIVFQKEELFSIFF